MWGKREGGRETQRLIARRERERDIVRKDERLRGKIETASARERRQVESGRELPEDCRPRRELSRVNYVRLGQTPAHQRTGAAEVGSLKVEAGIARMNASSRGATGTAACDATAATEAAIPVQWSERQAAASEAAVDEPTSGVAEEMAAWPVPPVDLDVEDLAERWCGQCGVPCRVLVDQLTGVIFWRCGQCAETLTWAESRREGREATTVVDWADDDENEENVSTTDDGGDDASSTS